MSATQPVQRSAEQGEVGNAFARFHHSYGRREIYRLLPRQIM